MLTLQETGEALWLGRRVKQVSGIPELIGRVGTVSEYFVDEKNVWHCFCANDAGGFWCPIHNLRYEHC